MNSISTRRRIVAALLLPFALVLAGCGKLHADFDIQDVDTIDVSYDVGIDEEFTAGQFDSADDMCSSMQDEMDVVGDMAPDIEPYEKDGQLGCLVTGVLTSDKFGTGFDLSESDGEYHLVIEGDESISSDLDSPELSGFDVDFRMTFTFPGKVIDSKGGQIDGDSVTYTDLNEMAQGVDIRAESGSFPWIIVVVAVIVIGFLFLLVLAAVVFFVLRARRNKGASAAVPGGYGAAAATGAAQGQAPQPGQPGQGQAQPGQGQPGAVPGQGQPGAVPGQPGQGQAQPGQPGQGQQWGGPASPPPAPQQDQQWGPSSPQGGQPWDQGGQQGGQQWGQGGQQPPQNSGW